MKDTGIDLGDTGGGGFLPLPLPATFFGLLFSGLVLLSPRIAMLLPR